MPVSPQSVLAAILVASGFGALVMCLLVLRYGFAAPPDDASQARRREVATRLGHAIAATCFAATAILAVVLMAHARREPGAPSPVPGDEPDGLEQVVGTRVSGVSERLAALELRVDAMEAGVRPLDDRVSDTRAQLDLVAAELEHATPRVSAVESLVRQHTDELGRATARLRQLEAQQAVVRQRPPPTPSGVSGPRAAEPAPPARWIPARETPAPSPPSRSPVPLPRGMAPSQPPTRGVAPAPEPPHTVARRRNRRLAQWRGRRLARRPGRRTRHRRATRQVPTRCRPRSRHGPRRRQRPALVRPQAAQPQRGATSATKD
jgi:uncharacterized coiled-coil protein SlyX